MYVEIDVISFSLIINHHWLTDWHFCYWFSTQIYTTLHNKYPFSPKCPKCPYMAYMASVSQLTVSQNYSISTNYPCPLTSLPLPISLNYKISFSKSLTLLQQKKAKKEKKKNLNQNKLKNLKKRLNTLAIILNCSRKLYSMT